MMNRIAKARRKADPNANVWGPDELVPFKDRFSAKEVIVTWIRPFKMFLTEPIVLVLSLLSGFSDALIFMFIQSFALVYDQWHFNAYQIGLAFLSIGIGYVIAWALFIPAIWRNKKERAAKPEGACKQARRRTRTVRVSSVVPALHRTLPSHRSLWLCLDNPRTSNPLDRQHDLRRHHWYRQLCHLHGHH